jgi:UDP-2,4-diacetamido-2,4,6-trideoxy-beta-L-altropyranose hydrolase
MKNILFRADSSSIIGVGHIMRDLVLAKRDFKNDNIIFATRNLEGNINNKIKKAGYKIEILHSDNIEELDKIIKKLKIDMIVIDNYKIDYNYEKQLSMLNPMLSIMVIDDTYQKHYCDILLNHNISANEKKYENLVSKNCEIRCGSKYTLIRDEFIKEKLKIKKNKNNTFTFFIAMGGADYNNIGFKVLKVLEIFKNIKINLVTTTANPNIKILQTYIKDKNHIKLHINSNKLAKLMKESNFAIVTPSVILHEVLYMELPFIAIKTADNQDDIYNYLKQNNYNVLDKFDYKKLKELIKNIISSK